MTFLLDTHFVLWLPIGGRGISRSARRLVNESTNRLLFSAASLWEIALKRARYRGNYAFDPRVIRKQLLENGFDELPITGQHVVIADSLPRIHKNPLDRLIIAQALVEGITLLTADETIARYPGSIRKV